MSDASTQTDADLTTTGILCDYQDSRARSAKTNMIHASTQTTEYGSEATSSTGSPSTSTTLVNTPVDVAFEREAEDSENQKAVDDQNTVHETTHAEEHNEELSSSNTMPEHGLFADHPDQVQECSNRAELQPEAQAQTENEEAGITPIPAAGSTTLVEKSVLNDERTAHDKTRQELDNLKADIASKDGRIEHYRKLADEVTESRDRLRDETTAVQNELDETKSRASGFESWGRALQVEAASLLNDLETATSRISGLELETENYAAYIVQKDIEIENLKSNVTQMTQYINIGSKEFTCFLQLSARLFTRLNGAEKLLKGALGRDDRLMRSAARRFAKWGVPVEPYFRDVAREESKPTPKKQLAIE